jgi:hypothetical protein
VESILAANPSMALAAGLAAPQRGRLAGVTSRVHVLELLEEGHTYETAGRELGIPAGQAYMIATGLAADGGDVPAPEELEGKPLLPGSSQHLVNPPPFNPTRKQHVVDWVRERAARELSPGAR